MKTALDIIHKHRLEALEDKGTIGGLRFEKVKIRFSDGSLFYDGWVQDLGLNSGPTVFETNYDNHNLESEETFEHKKYDSDVSIDEAAIRVATNTDIEAIIDLRFHNYFDEYYNRISAFQALNHKIDDKHLTLVVEIENLIVGHIYYVLHDNGVAYLDDLYVHKNFRGKQFATLLLNVSFAMLRKNGVRRIDLMLIGNTTQCEFAARLYDRLGFVVKECREGVNGFVEATMTKELCHTGEENF